MGSKGGSTTSSSTSKPPADVTKNYDYVSGLAKQVASQPLSQYTGPLLAGFTPDQNSAFTGIQNAQNAYQPYFNQAQTQLQNSTQPLTPFSASAVQQYENPYQQDVINATMEQLNQQNAIDQSSELGKAISGGAFGGDRAGIAAAQLAKNQQLNNASVLSGLNSQNYQQALSQFNTSNSQQQQQNALGIQAAGAYGNLGNSAEQNQLAQSLAQLQAGNQQQQLQQQALQIPYQQFEQQQQYPFQTTQWLASILEGTNPGGGTTTSTQPSQDNTFSDILGAGELGVGIAGLSDRRAKEDIKRVGKLDNGLPVYTYKYKGDDETRMGLMAQDVEKQNPDSVGSVGGLKTVDYDTATYARGGSVPMHYDLGGLIPSYVPDDSTLAQNNNRTAGIMPQAPQPQQQNNSSDLSNLSGLLAALGKLTSTKINGAGSAPIVNASSLQPGTYSDGVGGAVMNNSTSTGLAGLFGGGDNGYLGGKFADGGSAKRTLTTSSPEVTWTGNDFSFPSDANLKLTDADLKKYGIPKNNKFADGGATDPFSIAGATQVQNFNPIVAGTPVYSFNPSDAAKMGTVINPPASTGTTAPTQTAGPTPTQSDLLGALSRTSSQGPTGPGGAGFDISNGITTDLLNSIINPKGKSSFDPVGQQWVDYNGDPYEGAKSGGRMHFDVGGGVGDGTGDLSSLYDLFTPERSAAFFNGANAPDISQSPVPDITAPPQATNAASGPPIAPPPQSNNASGPPIQQQAANSQAASATNPMSMSLEDLQNQFSAPKDDSYLGKLAADPTRMALIRAGLGTLAGGSRYAGQNIGQGGLLALQGYSADKKAQSDAKLEALKTYAELQKAKSLQSGLGGTSPLAIAVRARQLSHPNEPVEDSVIAATAEIKNNGAGLTNDLDLGNKITNSLTATKNAEKMGSDTADVDTAEQKAQNSAAGKNKVTNLVNTQDIINKSGLISNNIDKAINMMKVLQKNHPDISGSTSWTSLAQKYQQQNPAAKKDIDAAIAGINEYGATNLVTSIKPYLQGTGQVRQFEGQNLGKIFSFDPDISLTANIQKFEQAKQGVADAKTNALKTYQASQSGKLVDSSDSTPTNLPDGAKKAPDGKYYVPDPNRPGKYLMVQ